MYTLSDYSSSLSLRINMNSSGTLCTRRSITFSFNVQLRVFDRQGVLQNTSEPVAGLEHALSWRPSGNLIAGTQRFGFEGGGSGTKGRHDVVFFERNGLRHGEFTLREVSKPLPSEENDWTYKVKELAWNSDSTILSIWISTDNGDVGELDVLLVAARLIVL